MAQKMTGALVFDECTDRYDIRFDLASYYEGIKKRRSCFPCYGIEKRRVCVVFSFHLFFQCCVRVFGLAGFRGWHIKALSLKSSKLVVNSA